MKKSILICLVAAIFFACKNKPNAQETSTGYTITGTIKGLSSGTVKIVEEGNRDRSKLKTINSTEIANGEFKLTGKVEHPDMVSLVINDKSSSFFLENSPIEITINWSDGKENDWRFNSTVSGSKTHDEYTKIDQEAKAVFKDPKYKVLDSLRNLVIAAKKSKNQKDMDKVSALQKELRPLMLEQSERYTSTKFNYAKANPSSPVAVHILGFQYSEGRMSKDQLKEYYNLFTGDARKTSFFKNYITKVYKDNFENLGVGNTAPDFTLKNLENNNLTLSKINAKYKLVDFWASWCVPCRNSFPHLKELRKEYKNDGFEIIGIGTADVEEKWRKAIKEDQTPWLHGFDTSPVKNGRASYGAIAKAYGVPHLPTTFLVDANNTIVLRNPTKEELDAKLKELFGH